MREIRISGTHNTGDRGDPSLEGQIFVFDDETDAVLVHRWQQGDLASASIAIQRHEGTVYASVFRLLRNHALSEDVCQDAFLRAHERIATLRRPAAFSGWVRRIAVRMAVDELRRGTLSELTEEEPDTHPGPEALLETLDALERLRSQVDALPPGQRAVIVLRDIEGLSTQETAEELSISEGAVKMRLGRARATLKRLLQTGQEGNHE